MKTILITGTTSGIGKVTATELARQGHHVIMANRNREKAERVRQAIMAETGNKKLDLLDLDLASLASVNTCAESYLESHGTLDILLNNAGVMAQEEIITDDGFELLFGVNCLAQFLFTLKLLPALQAVAPSQVIFVSSMMHKFAKLDFGSFRGGNKFKPNAAYGQSKLALMLVAAELAERLRPHRVAVNTLHPGAVNTGILDSYGKAAQLFLRKLFVAPEKGAKTSLYLTSLHASATPTGRYFVNSKEAKPGKHVANVELRRQMWDLCCEYAGVVPTI